MEMGNPGQSALPLQESSVKGVSGLGLGALGHVQVGMGDSSGP